VRENKILRVRSFQFNIEFLKELKMNKKILTISILISTFNLLGAANAEQLHYTIYNRSYTKTLSVCNGYGVCRSSNETNSMEIIGGFFCMERSTIAGSVHYEAQVQITNPNENVTLVYSLSADDGQDKYPTIKLTNAVLFNDKNSPLNGKCPIIG
jgi:hypothetical protein